MNKHYKFFTIFSIIITVIFSAKLYDENLNTQRIKELSIKYQAGSIADFLVAFRVTYQDIFIEKYTILDESNINFLPVRTTNSIAKIFSHLNMKSKIATVSRRPRNPINMANQRQLKVINYFQKNKNIKSYFKTINNTHYYSQPLYITKTCLKCHGKKDDAPNIIKNNYDMSYDYKVGDLKGIIDIEIEQTKLSILLADKYNQKLLFASILWSLILMFTFFYARHNKKLEERIHKEEEKNREKEKQLIQQSRMAQMGEMLSMIAHQWRQPLAAISASSASIELKAGSNNLDNDIAIQKAQDISDFSQHLSKTIDDFRDFFKPNKEKSKTTYDEVIRSVLSIIEVSIINKNIQLIQELNCHETFSTYPNELKQVVLNLIKNAEDVLLEKEIEDPTIKIATYIKEDRYILEVSDNAGGIPEDIINKIFDPYFSTKQEKDGTGLGLYMSKMIIEEHCGGELSVSNGDEGAMFKIVIQDIADKSKVSHAEF